MKKERSNQRSTSPFSSMEKGRGGGAGASPSKGSRPPSSKPPPRKQEETSFKPLRDDLVLVGEFGRAQGLKGEVRLKSHTGEPEAIAGYRPLLAADGRPFIIRNVRRAPGGAPDMLVAQVDGVTTREAAEALNRVRLYLERDKLPPPDEDEFLLADLIGLPVQDEAGKVVGTIVDVPNYGGGDLLEIAPAQKGPTALLPFTKAFVPEIDIAQKRVVVALPDDFFEPAKPEPEGQA